MPDRFIKLIGCAGIVDALLLMVTMPLIQFLLPFFLPQELVSSADVIWTYGLVIFSTLLAIVLFLLWTLESWYMQWFDFWDLVVAMLVIGIGVVYWNRGFAYILPK